MQHAGLPVAETLGPSSHNTSITDAVMSLPDLLRARSAQLVGALELGAPLGRGSFGKVYKGALPHNCCLSQLPARLWLLPTCVLGSSAQAAQARLHCGPST